MRILIVQHANFINGSGGTEKICSFLANTFEAGGHEVIIGTNEKIAGKPVFPLSENIEVKNIYSENDGQIKFLPIYNYLGKNPLRWLSFKLEKKFAKAKNRKIIQDTGGEEKLYFHNLSARAVQWKKYIDGISPDVIITMSIGSLLEITYNNEYDIPIINSTNGRPDYDYSDILWYRPDYEMKLLEAAYRHLSGIQVLFESYRSYIPKSFTGKVFVISNPINGSDNTHFPSNQKDRHKVTHVGTLNVSCKQQDLAIDVFNALAASKPNWILEFWGEGKDFKLLKKKIKSLKLENRVFLRGFTDDPIRHMKEADIFIFPSKYEGFGLALAEAMSVGLPCLGLASCSGVNELILHKKTGYLADNNEQLQAYLSELMDNEVERNAIGGAGKEFILEKCSHSLIERQWIDLVDNFKQ
ncbi:glycosyltransferase [Sphingobacterium zeae]|uniref:Glycosyltransferase involved in cell wall biosynthesis n=1 Tax=Sphingobacterium zeae TaxID=1776859 RepID=A0ABU0U2D8_9SPHI|nr:glycosyltransferase [Sphingobacterium zeae]MDQ1148974.1 glycosyltransferase involved in cell wall biosynthesis [Sphingobacterium zeae]